MKSSDIDLFDYAGTNSEGEIYILHYTYRYDVMAIT